MPKYKCNKCGEKFYTQYAAKKHKCSSSKRNSNNSISNSATDDGISLISSMINFNSIDSSPSDYSESSGSDFGGFDGGDGGGGGASGDY